MNDPNDKWQKLVAAAARSRAPEPEHKTPPPGFAARIVALRQSVVAMARVLLWRRWSVILAMLCLLVLGVVFSLYRCTRPEPPLIEMPELQPPPP